MFDIPVSSPLSYVGVFLAILGFFLILAGLSIIRIEKVTVAPGRKTWIGGIVILLAGIAFLLPDILSQVKTPTPTPTPLAGESTAQSDQEATPSEAAPQSDTVDPYLYDDFEDTDFDGGLDQVKWISFQAGSAQGRFEQQDGVMVITRSGGTDDPVGMDLRTYRSFLIDKPFFFETQLKLPARDNPQNGQVYIGLFSDIKTDDYASCKLDYDEGKNMFICALASNKGDLFDTGVGNFQADQWYKFRIEVYPPEMEFIFYINDFNVGSYTHQNANDLRESRFFLSIGLNGWEQEDMTAYIDTVRIGDIK